MHAKVQTGTRTLTSIPNLTYSIQLEVYSKYRDKSHERSFATNPVTVTALKTSAGSWFQIVITRELKKYLCCSLLNLLSYLYYKRRLWFSCSYLMCRWLDAGKDDAAIEKTLFLSTTPTPQPSPEPSPSPEQPYHALTLPQLPPTHLMLSPVPEQGWYFEN